MNTDGYGDFQFRGTARQEFIFNHVLKMLLRQDIFSWIYNIPILETVDGDHFLSATRVMPETDFDLYYCLFYEDESRIEACNKSGNFSYSSTHTWFDEFSEGCVNMEDFLSDYLEETGIPVNSISYDKFCELVAQMPFEEKWKSITSKFKKILFTPEELKSAMENCDSLVQLAWRNSDQDTVYLADWVEFARRNTITEESSIKCFIAKDGSIPDQPELLEKIIAYERTQLADLLDLIDAGTDVPEELLDIGILYETGLSGIEKNEKKAWEYYIAAVNAGFGPARKFVQEIFKEENRGLFVSLLENQVFDESQLPILLYLAKDISDIEDVIAAIV